MQNFTFALFYMIIGGWGGGAGGVHIYVYVLFAGVCMWERGEVFSN